MWWIGFLHVSNRRWLVWIQFLLYISHLLIAKRLLLLFPVSLWLCFFFKSVLDFLLKLKNKNKPDYCVKDIFSWNLRRPRFPYYRGHLLIRTSLIVEEKKFLRSFVSSHLNLTIKKSFSVFDWILFLFSRVFDFNW